MYKILVPVDFSKKSEYAVKMSAQIGKKIKSEIHLLHLVELPSGIIDMGAGSNFSIPASMMYLRKVKEKITHLRNRYTPLAKMIEKVSIGILFSLPLITAIFKVPHIVLLTASIGVLGMLSAVLVQLIVLPLEWDASFNKALPILIEGRYITQAQEAAVKSVLRAAAFTYVAAALADMLRLWRWLAILRGAIR